MLRLITYSRVGRTVGLVGLAVPYALHPLYATAYNYNSRRGGEQTISHEAVTSRRRSPKQRMLMSLQIKSPVCIFPGIT
nr:hypothetical protein BgiMline_024613 [Biomphalaria glabrata]